MTPPSNSSPSPGRSGFEADGKPPPNQFRVLVVDDQAANRLILSRLLNMAGYLTFEASDGQEALNHITSRTINLVIMDVEMPNMSGLEAIRKIRHFSDPRLASIPILAATGNPQAESRQKLLDAGANAFLTKPFEPQLLLKTVGTLLSPSPSSGNIENPTSTFTPKSNSAKTLP